MTSTPKYRLTRDDFVAHLKDQLEFLERSGRAYDEGAEGEAKRMAAVLRVLLHDTRNSTSLLTHLGAKEQLSYVDTAMPINPHNLAATPGLVLMEFGPGTEGRYVPPLGDLHPDRIKPNKPFKPWWEDPVTQDARGNLFSRKDYVLTASNQEGGAHVDHSLDMAYAELTKNSALGWMVHGGNEPEKPFERNPAFASVRQIAFEVERTLRQHPLKLGL